MEARPFCILRARYSPALPRCNLRTTLRGKTTAIGDVERRGEREAEGVSFRRPELVHGTMHN